MTQIKLPFVSANQRWTQPQPHTWLIGISRLWQVSANLITNRKNSSLLSLLLGLPNTLLKNQRRDEFFRSTALIDDLSLRTLFNQRGQKLKTQGGKASGKCYLYRDKLRHILIKTVIRFRDTGLATKMCPRQTGNVFSTRHWPTKFSNRFAGQRNVERKLTIAFVYCQYLSLARYYGFDPRTC